ncbi:hypothetical protein CkaCkLH20_02245 [Colletotrichum karsti]|uniref:Ankyrin repeat protein n=1 Tax=Colletotrichum karsti TaxID=1095194 RepID=A0A9P6LPD7_9PEZI|nr:uncharacterized protein CkaCkLH20_02245 [Colletotrichum karsti]KAF9880291.1 hypothetical protein CkaCkLH20_02245 [Colletotrichum karsti]
MREQLPASVPENPGLGRQISLAIGQRLNQDDVNRAMEEISNYTAVLNITLSTLLLAQNVDTKNSQGEILREVQNVARKLRNNIEISPQAQATTNNYVAIEGREVRNLNVAMNVQRWTSSASSLAEAVLLERNEDLAPSDSEAIKTGRTSSASDISQRNSLVVPFNSRLEFFKYQKNLEVARLLKEGELFQSASHHFQKAIDLRATLMERGVDGFEGAEHYDLLEELAELYRFWGTVDGNNMARESLEKLTAECDGSTLCASLEDLPGASKNLEIALQIRLEEEPRNQGHITETCQALLAIHHLAGDRASYLAIKDWVKKETGSVEEPPQVKLESALRWAQQHGFEDANIDDTGLPRFEAMDSEGRTLLHVAVVDSDIEPSVLEQIIQNVGNLDIGDRNGDTPLLASVSTSKASAVQLLLHYGANIDARDLQGHGVLHKCQSGKMADLIYNHIESSARKSSVVSTTSAAVRRSISSRSTNQVPLEATSYLDVNSQDIYGKTALFEACEKGRSDLVSVLLKSFNAKTDVIGPKGCSPLVAAIQMKPNIDIVQQLVAYGAKRDVDPDIIRSAGVLVADTIKKILKDTPAVQQRSTSTLVSVAPSVSLHLDEEDWTKINWGN